MPRQTAINDTIKTRWLAAATYSVTPSTSTMAAENSIVTFTVSTFKVPNGTTLYWTILNGTTTNADFVASSGSFVITASGDSGTGSFTVTGALDGLSESTETFQVQIRTTSVSGTVRTTSSSISIPNATYNLVSYPAGTSFNEGTQIYIDVETTKVEPGTTLYWSINHITTSAADFDVTSGSVSPIIGDTEFGLGDFNFTILNDLTTEGSQTFTVSVRSTSISGTALVTTPTWTINDTSVDAPNNRLYGWGVNSSYQLGDGTNINRSTPTLMVIGQPNLEPPFLKVATGGNHTMVIKADGTLWGIGGNESYQLGDGTQITRTSFVRVGTGSQLTWTWSDVICGTGFTVGLRATPSVGLYGWGTNDGGQTGTGYPIANGMYRSSPVACSLFNATGNTGLTINVTGPWDKLTAGPAQWTCRYAGGTYWIWAGNYYNAQNGLGSGITNHFSNATLFQPRWNNPNNNQLTAIYVTDWAIGDNFGAVLLSGGAAPSPPASGTVTVSGRNFQGQHGNNSTTSWFEFRFGPNAGAGRKWTKIAAAGQSMIGVKDDNTVWTWGGGSSGQLGIGTTVNRSTPQAVGLSAGSIQMGNGFTFARGIDGLLYSWGANGSGQLGLGFAGANQLTPQLVTPINDKSPSDIGKTGGNFMVSATQSSTVMNAPTTL